jgi:hypothetical protein
VRPVKAAIRCGSAVNVRFRSVTAGQDAVCKVQLHFARELGNCPPSKFCITPAMKPPQRGYPEADMPDAISRICRKSEPQQPPTIEICGYLRTRRATSVPSSSGSPSSNTVALSSSAWLQREALTTIPFSRG